MAAVFLLFVGATRGDCLCGNGGQVCFVAVANSSFDVYTSSPSPAQQAWMNDHYSGMVVYSPYFDDRLAWYPNGWVYKDVYAIYVGSVLAAQHPEWILRDGSGNALYIPFACSGGTCPQYAGDIGNPAFRANWIKEASATLAAGYAGLYEDDFNMAMQVGNGNGNLVVPWDPRTGALMTTASWRSYLAQFQIEIRTAFPTQALSQNQVWFLAPAGDPAVVSATRNADYVWIERGFNDTGIVGGTGKFGFQTLLAFIDAAHQDGAGVVVEPGSATWGRDYALATYFLFSNGADGFSSNNGGFPDNWWSGYDVDLGVPLDRYYTWNGLFRRDFAGGLVLVNQPGSPTVTVGLGAAYEGLDGLTYTSVTLGATSGIVLLSAAQPPVATTTVRPTSTTTITASTTTSSTTRATQAPTTTTKSTTTTSTTKSTTTTTTTTSTTTTSTTTTIALKGNSRSRHLNPKH
jgi:hypothetical protein